MREKAKMVEYEYNKVSNFENKQVEEDTPTKYGYGVRHIQLALFLLCLTVNIVIRGHMGVTIVAMTSQNVHITNNSNPIAHLTEENTTHLKKVYGEENELIEDFTISDNSIEGITTDNTTEIKHKTWDWPKTIQEMVLNSFFIGYMTMMFPMGMVCQRYGGKLPLQIALFVNGIASIATPWLTIWGGWKGLCCSRVLQGLTQAGTYPSIQGLLAKWVPADERATMGCCVHTGLTIGTVIAFQLAGFLGASKWGWPSTFYTIGVICLLTFILLTIFGAATPMEHKTITDAERNYIMGAANNGNNKKQKTPWKAIFTSRPLWGTIITHCGSNVAFVFFFNQVPTYIHHTLDIDVRNSGLLSSLPYVASFFTILGFGWLSDYCTNKNIVSKNNARRISNSIGNFGLVGCLLLTSYTDNAAVVVTCLVIAMAADMGINTGWMVNYIDLAPNFGGTLTAIGNTLSNVFVVLTPIVVSHVVTDMSDVRQWRIMFFITAGVGIVTGAIFVLLLSTDIQPWNYPSWNESCVEDQEKELQDKKKKSCDLS